LIVAELKSGETLKLYDGRKHGVGEGLAEVVGMFPMGLAALLRNFISFYHQAYRVAVWRSRHNYLYLGAELTRLTLSVLA
jgi:hypothetical protein